MARGPKKSSVKREYTPIENVIWFCSFAAVSASIVCVGISIFLPNWRESGPITYNYIHKASKRQHTVDQTKYGLHSVVYDNYMTKQTWSKRVSNVKSKGYMAIQNSSQNHRGGYKNFFVNECPAACRDGISARIRVYENLLGYNNILLVVLVILDVITGLGVLWFLILGKNLPVVGGSWILSGSLGFGSTIYWNRVTHKTWLVAVRSQMIPFPYVSYCYRVSLVANSVITCAALSLFFSDIISQWFRKRKMEASLNEYLKEKNALDFGVTAMPFGKPTAPNFQAQNPVQNPPVMNQQVMPQGGFNPGALFNGMGFNNNNNMKMGNNNAPSSPSMWAKNFQL